MQHSALGKGFQKVFSELENPSIHDLLSALDSARCYTLQVLEYLRKDPYLSDMAVLADKRNFTQHALMSLPPKADIDAGANSIFPLYEPCRLAAIIFSLIVVFPIPASTAPFAELGRRLREALTDQDFRQIWPKSSRLVLWILFMGGIAAVNSEHDRNWYVSVLERVAGRSLKIDSWTGIKAVLEDHLWLEEINENDGKTLWREVELLDPFIS